MKKVTLKQIAEMAGVSTTTVHRALNGKGGCSREVEGFILKIAREHGYSANMAASALRKQPLQIAFIFPFRDNGGRFGLDQMLDGYLEYRRDLKDYNIVFQEFLLRSSDEKLENYLDMEYPELEHVLQQISLDQPVHYDGLIIYGMSVTRKAEALLNRIIGRGTKVVLLERIVPSMEDTCTVKAHMELSGNIAAEILCAGIPDSGTVALVSQIVPGGDPAADAFVEYLRKEKPGIKTVRLPLVMNVDQGEVIASFLQQQEGLVGLYITTGRHTKSTLDALRLIDTKEITCVGSVLFAESYKALKDRVLNAVLDNRSEKIGYMALHLLLTELIKNKPAPALYLVPPRIILRSNCDAHYVKKEYQHESERYCD